MTMRKPGPGGDAGDLAAQEAFVRAISETSPAMLWMGDASARCVFLNGALRRFWGVDPQNLDDFDWSSTLHPDDVTVLAGPFTEAMANHTPFSVEARYKRADGVYRTMRTEANPRFGADGTFLGMSGVNTDITDQLRAEEHTRRLMGELNHRTKNLLAVVQAVARQTAKTAPDDFLGVFDARLAGLAASNDLLLRNDWSGVLLGELVEAQLAHLVDLFGKRLLPSGPDLWIDSSSAQTLGMALHELATNSIKHGALGQAQGIVNLAWRRMDDGGFEIHWQEKTAGGAKKPKRKGFGHVVTIDMVAATFGAKVTTDYGADGFTWHVLVPGKAA